MAAVFPASFTPLASHPDMILFEADTVKNVMLDFSSAEHFLSNPMSFFWDASDGLSARDSPMDFTSDDAPDEGLGPDIELASLFSASPTHILAAELLEIGAEVDNDWDSSFDEFLDLEASPDIYHKPSQRACRLSSQSTGESGTTPVSSLDVDAGASSSIPADIGEGVDDGAPPRTSNSPSTGPSIDCIEEAPMSITQKRRSLDGVNVAEQEGYPGSLTKEDSDSEYATANKPEPQESSRERSYEFSHEPSCEPSCKPSCKPSCEPSCEPSRESSRDTHLRNAKITRPVWREPPPRQLTYEEKEERLRAETRKQAELAFQNDELIIIHE